MRLKQRRKVDLPQPEGPISAVTLLLADRHADVLQRLHLAVAEIQRTRLGLEALSRCAHARGRDPAVMCMFTAHVHVGHLLTI